MNNDDDDSSPSKTFRKSVLDSLEEKYSNSNLSAPATSDNASKKATTSMDKHNDDDIINNNSSSNNNNNNGVGSPRPLLIRRQSSLFSQLPTRSRSHLFDHIGALGSSSSSNHNNNKNSQRSSWMPEEGEDNQSTLMASQIGEEKTLFGTSSNSGQEEEKRFREPKSSLFGAVMRKVSSSISHALPGSPFGKTAQSTESLTTNAVGSSTTGKHSGGGGGGGTAKETSSSLFGGGVTGILSSPSGKTIRNLVNRFNSPFKFQSPTRSHKRQRRTSSPSAVNTPPSAKRQRRGLDVTPTTANRNSNLLFPEESMSSRSSLMMEDEDEDGNWTEAPIVGNHQMMEILDWSLPHHLRMELHNSSPTCLDSSLDVRSLSSSDAWKDALTYWEFRPMLMELDKEGRDGFASTTSSTWERQNSFTSKSKEVIKMNRRMPLLGPTLKQASNLSAGNKNAVGLFDGGANSNAASTATSDSGVTALARHLVLSVRGQNAVFSRKAILEEEQEVSYGRLVKRQWQQSLRDLYLNYCQKVQSFQMMQEQQMDSHNDDQKILLMMKTYFYCIGQDHVVLFRVVQDDQKDNSLLPSVLISSTSETFRKQMQVSGVEALELLETREEKQARENLMTESNKFAGNTGKKKMNDPAMSPSVKADLEALRRAQAFGESVGADVTVKIKKPFMGTQLRKQQTPKTVRVCGWDDVSLVFEMYLNSYGNVAHMEETGENGSLAPEMNGTRKCLPILVCHSGLGPFEHSSMKKLRLMYAAPKTEEATIDRHTDNNNSPESDSHAINIYGTILPCAIRKLIVLGRNLLLSDEGTSVAIKAKPQPLSPPGDASRYIVLHSMRPSKQIPRSRSRVTKESLVLNQGRKQRKNDAQGMVFECPTGKVVAMAVWDSSREEVAACKLENIWGDTM
jgi:hypothetical protein